MFVRSITTIAMIALSAQMASATPPACLLAAINTQPNPAAMATICGPHASDVQTQIQHLCGANTSEAMKSFSTICSAAGHHVSAPKPHHKPTTTKKHKPSSHMTHKPSSHMTHKPSSHPTHKPAKSSSAPHAHNAPVSKGGSTGTVHAPAQTQSTGPSSGSKGFNGAAGRVDANAFAALAMAAAGLAIFL